METRVEHRTRCERILGLTCSFFNVIFYVFVVFVAFSQRNSHTQISQLRENSQVPVIEDV